MTNSRDKNERSLLMKSVLQSKATIIKNLRPFETRIYFSNFISKVKNEHYFMELILGDSLESVLTLIIP